MRGRADSGSNAKAASLEEVQKIAEQRCVPCHSANPTMEGYEDGPPAGLELDKAENIEARKDRIYQLVVVKKEMPFVNQTHMTQAERDRFASWAPRASVPHVKRLQIMIDEDLDEALGRQARAEGTSKAALIRRYVRDRIKPVPPIHEDPLWEIAGMAEGSPTDSMSVNEVVYGPKHAE